MVGRVHEIMRSRKLPILQLGRGVDQVILISARFLKNDFFGISKQFGFKPGKNRDLN